MRDESVKRYILHYEMGTVEKLVKALEALKVSSETASAAAAAAEDGVAVGGVGIGSGVVSGLLGAATRKKDGVNLTRREKVHHCNFIADSLNATSVR